MNRYRALLLTTLLFLAASGAVRAEEEPYELEIVRRDGGESMVAADITARSGVFTNGLIIKFKHPTYGQGVLVADQAYVNYTTGDLAAGTA